MANVIKEYDLVLEPEQDVYLSIVLGDGQYLSESTIFIDKTYEASFNEVKSYCLGSYADLKDKQLLVKTDITDTNPKTNFTSVIYTLRSGGAVLSTPEHFQVPKANDTATYKITYNLK